MWVGTEGRVRGKDGLNIFLRKNGIVIIEARRYYHVWGKIAWIGQ